MRKKKNVSEMRTCPKIANVYNENMGGIDLHDAHRSRISTHLRTKKWWTPLFYGCLDIALVNFRINWKEAKSVNITFHEFVITIIQEIQHPIGWWKSSPNKELSSDYPEDRHSIVNEVSTHEPFLIKRSRNNDPRKNCVICNKKTKMGCQTCNFFVHFVVCWKVHQNQ